jgi:hypothetical protein
MVFQIMKRRLKIIKYINLITFKHRTLDSVNAKDNQTLEWCVVKEGANVTLHLMLKLVKVQR